jgi:AcrR family transcriptional regulator
VFVVAVCEHSLVFVKVTCVNPRAGQPRGGAVVAVEAKREPKRQERGRQRMALILDTAERVFDEVGYDAATTNLIAAEAGISPGSLYQFFANKEAIAEALASRYVDLMADVEAAALDPTVVRLPLPEMVDRIIDPMITFTLEHPAAKALLAGADLSPRLAQATEQMHDAIVGRTEALVAARLPHLDGPSRARVAVVSLQIYKALLPTVLDAAPRQRGAYVAELKAALVGYWSTLEAAAP